MNHPFFAFERPKVLLLKKFKSYYPTIRYIRNLDVFFYVDSKSGIWKMDHRNLILKKMIKIDFPKRIYDDFQTRISNNEENQFIRDVLSLKDKLDTTLEWLQQSRNVMMFINELKYEIFFNDLSSFNADPNLILFKNDVVIDLRLKKVVNVHWTDMVANNQSLNISFEPEDNDKITLLANIFNEIILCKKEKAEFLRFLFDALSGFKPKKFMLNFGGKYKTIIMDIFVNILGTYAMKPSYKTTNALKFRFSDKYDEYEYEFEKIFCKRKEDVVRFNQSHVIVIDNLRLEDLHIMKGLTASNEYHARLLFEPIIALSPSKATYFVIYDEIDLKQNELRPLDEAIRNRILKTKFKTQEDANFEALFNDKFIAEYGMQLIHYLFKFSD